MSKRPKQDKLTPVERRMWLHYVQHGNMTEAYLHIKPEVSREQARKNGQRIIARIKKKSTRKCSLKNMASAWTAFFVSWINASRQRLRNISKHSKLVSSKITKPVWKLLSSLRIFLDSGKTRSMLTMAFSLVLLGFLLFPDQLQAKTIGQRQLQTSNLSITKAMKINPDSVIWKPQAGSQELFLSCPVFECLYEGTRGPGKTDGLLMDFAQHIGQGYGAAWRGLLFRREYKELADVVTKSKKWFSRIFPKARFLESQSEFKWRWETGEELLFRTVKRVDDYWNYHGHEYPWIGWEELTNWPDSKLYMDMMSVCRSSTPGLPRKYRATANPYGVGHNWVKARFIDPAPPGNIITDEKGRERVRLHGNIYENKILLEADPDYLLTLQSITDKNKKRAWLFGDWDIVAGGMFDDVFQRDVHVIKPFQIPSSWYFDRSFDWGSSKPFSVGWWAESDGSQVTLANGKQYTFPRGTLFRIAEWYGWNGEPNEGCKMVSEEIGKTLREYEKLITQKYSCKIKPGPADSSIFNEIDGDSIAQKINSGYHGSVVKKNRNIFTTANKAPGSRKQGWEILRTRLSASLKQPMENPGIFVFDNCTQWVRTFPVLPRDSKDPEDIDTLAEDHIADETRYRVLASRNISRRVRVSGV